MQSLLFIITLLFSFHVFAEFTLIDNVNETTEQQKRLYNLLKDRELSLISVGHRPSLKDFHENILELNGKGDWQLLTTDKYNFKN